MEISVTGESVPELAPFDRVLTEYLASEKIPGGALAVMKDGRLLLARGYGTLDRRRNDPVLPTSLFRIASVSKPITGAAILTLVDDGRLALDAPVSPILSVEPFLSPNTRADSRIAQITVRHLLQHTGGFDRAISPDPMFDHARTCERLKVASPPSRGDLIRVALGRPLDFSPGTRYAYSNFGYCLLGRVIEKISGESYESFVKNRVFRRMGVGGMRIGRGRWAGRFPGESAYHTVDDRTERSVFTADGPGRIPEPYATISPETMDAHGGWVSSVRDLARFTASFDRPEWCPISQLAKITLATRPKPPLGLESDGSLSASFYGLGWNVRPIGNAGRANWWHVGGMSGTGSIVVRRHDGLAWCAIFNQRDSVAIDARLHEAAARVSRWPTFDRFLGE